MFAPSSSSAIESEPAPAKINLALQVTGRRADGYHLLDSLVSFIDLVDWLHVDAVPPDDASLVLTLHGAMGAVLAADQDNNANEDNLVLRAARLLQEISGVRYGARLRLEKHIPIGAGLGGGSADASAALRVLNRVWQCGLQNADLQYLAAKLGADVSACVASTPVRMQGIGEVLSPLPPLPPSITALLVYPPAHPLATPAVYQSGKVPFSGALSVLPATPDDWEPAIAHSVNDLYPAACSLSTEVAAMIASLESLGAETPDGALAVRMSGSGSACFALFTHAAEAKQVEQRFRARHPECWTQRCRPITGLTDIKPAEKVN